MLRKLVAPRKVTEHRGAAGEIGIADDKHSFGKKPMKFTWGKIGMIHSLLNIRLEKMLRCFLNGLLVSKWI